VTHFDASEELQGWPLLDEDSLWNINFYANYHSTDQNEVDNKITSKTTFLTQNENNVEHEFLEKHKKFDGIGYLTTTISNNSFNDCAELVEFTLPSQMNLMITKIYSLKKGTSNDVRTLKVIFNPNNQYTDTERITNNENVVNTCYEINNIIIIAYRIN